MKIKHVKAIVSLNSNEYVLRIQKFLSHYIGNTG